MHQLSYGTNGLPPTGAQFTSTTSDVLDRQEQSCAELGSRRLGPGQYSPGRKHQCPQNPAGPVTRQEQGQCATCRLMHHIEGRWGAACLHSARDALPESLLAAHTPSNGVHSKVQPAAAAEIVCCAVRAADPLSAIRLTVLLTMWYSLPASSSRRCGVDHIHKPLVHGRVVEPIWKPPVICRS